MDEAAGAPPQPPGRLGVLCVALAWRGWGGPVWLVPEEKAALKQLVDSCCDVRKAMAMRASNIRLCASA